MKISTWGRSFYRELLGVEETCSDETHQFVLAEETALTVYNDGTDKNNQNQNICLAFTVDDIDKAYEKVLSLGARIIEPPAKRPWSAINMSFLTLTITWFTFEAFRRMQKNSEQKNHGWKVSSLTGILEQAKKLYSLEGCVFAPVCPCGQCRFQPVSGKSRVQAGRLP